MVISFISHSRAQACSSFPRIIVPSSRIISQHKPQGARPAKRIKSTVASVWPFRSKTPFFLASRGNIWPGRRNSCGTASSRQQARAVMPRSSAEIPVVVLVWSIETVKAVSWLSVLSVTMGNRANFRHNSRLIGIQIKPLAWDAIKFTFSVVANWAAQIISPSFSRFSSSVTRMIFPARKSSKASSMVLY